MNLSQQPVRQYTKAQQLKSNRTKPTQKQMGNISPKVRSEVRSRSKGICEIRELCTGDIAVNQAHLKGRRIIERKTTADDLLDACYACHKWADESVQGIRFKRKVREIGTTEYLKQIQR